jgi:Family of unknown function (DUF6325)
MPSAQENDALGPISYLIVEFPGAKMTGEGLAELLRLVDQGLVRILDLQFVLARGDGSIEAVELDALDLDGSFDLTVFEGASSGMLDDSDLADAQSAIEPGAAAAILIFENTWATPFVQALRKSDAQLVAAGYIPHDALVASLDATE